MLSKDLDVAPLCSRTLDVLESSEEHGIGCGVRQNIYLVLLLLDIAPERE